MSLFKIFLFDAQHHEVLGQHDGQTGRVQPDRIEFRIKPCLFEGEVDESGGMWSFVNAQETIKGIQDEMNFHKKEVQILKSEKDTLESVLSMKTQDVKKTLTNELMRIEEEMKRYSWFIHT